VVATQMSPDQNTREESQAQKFVNLENLPDMEDLLGESENASTVSEGTVLTGTVSEKRDSGALIDIGFKAEGFVPKEEFRDFANVQEGQEVDVYLELVEDDEEMPLISVQKAEAQKAWQQILEERNEGDVVTGTVRNRVKGGLIVDIGVDAFLPGSQIDIGPVRNLDDFVGHDLEVKILKINPERRNIVVSRRELLEQKRAEQRNVLLSELEKGEVRTGVVKNITDFGAFIDLNGMDGLLHITDMSWGRISHPSEMVKLGDEIDVMILDIDYDRQRVSLGLKQKEGNPWEGVEEKYPVGSRVTGRVVNIMPYGAFVELEKGVEGLIHVSEMTWTKRINKASELLEVGDEVEAVVLDVDAEARKISLSWRQTTENPWEKLAAECPQGTKIKGVVRNMTSYGAFVQIQDDIDGMIHVSDLSWTKKVNHPSAVLEKGQEVEAVVLDIDPEQQRVSLGLKQLQDDPWTGVSERYQVGDTVQGQITKLTSFGAFVALEDGIEGLVHVSELSDEPVENPRDVLQAGDEVQARIIRIDPAERRLGLSLRSSQESGDTASTETHHQADQTQSEPADNGTPSASAFEHEGLQQLQHFVPDQQVEQEEEVEDQSPDQDEENSPEDQDSDESASPKEDAE